MQRAAIFGPLRGSSARHGIGRVELLILLALLLLLFTTVAPALPEIREWSRARQCHDNLRRLGIAIDQYHDRFRTLPAAACWDDARLLVDEDMRPVRSPEHVRLTRQNWVQALLPDLGETELAASFASSASVTDPANEAARTTRLPPMVCPTDNYNAANNAYVLTLSDGSEFAFARGNYAINGGSHGNVEFPGRLSFPVTDGNVIKFRPERNEFQWWGNGIAGFNKSFSFDDFQNGRSTTVAVDEIRAGIVPEDSRGVWALGQIGASVTWAHGVNADDFGPNNQLADSDDILEGRTISAKYGMERFFAEQMPFCAHCSYSNQATSRSRHSNGVNVLMADGASRSVSDEVSPSLWHVMHSRETPRGIISELDESIAGVRDAEKPKSSVLPSEPDAKSQSRTSPAGRIDNSIGISLARILPGSFILGRPDAGNTWAYPEKEAPPHEVHITRPFYLACTEVTQQQFQKVMQTNPSWHQATGGGSQLVGSKNTNTMPVENVTWYEAADFCRKLSERPEEVAAHRTYRLPTEAEWEFGCRAGATEPRPFVSTWPNPNDFQEIAGKEKHAREPLVPLPVGSTPANAFGLSETRGGVFEWTADWFDRSYYAHSPADDPQGPSTGYLKVVRGWDWVFIGPQCKDFHLVTPPWIRSRYVGFRVVMEPSTH